VGKGLSGGTIIVRPTVSSPLTSQQNSIIGNTVLYGATSGRFAALAAISGGSEHAPNKVAAAKHTPRVLKLNFII
jgi:hypothetical protein